MQPAPTTSPPPDRRYGLLLPAVLALLLPAALLLVQRHLDFTPNEEGFLWYGAVATAHGDVPLRDFYAYDPGRYYWAAAWSPLVGTGLSGLRLATTAFACLGLFCGLLAARRAVTSRLALSALAVVLTLWLLPRNKLYEPAVAMAAILAATALVERPTLRRHLLAGVAIGLALFLGKNHGLYLGVAFVALTLLLWFRRDRDRHAATAAGNPGDAAADAAPSLLRRFAALTAGGLFGAAPLVAMLALVPGFAGAYLDSILFFLHQGRTNFPLPVPWPWRFHYAGLTAWAAAQTLSIGAGFLLTAAFFLAGGIAVLCLSGPRLRRHALFVAAVVVGAVYTHHAFSRADLAHLAPSIDPLLLGLAALPRAAGAAAAAAARARHTHRGATPDGTRRTAADNDTRGTATPDGTRRTAAAAATAAALLVALVLGALTAATALPAQPFFRRLSGQPMTACDVAGETLWLRPRTADLLLWVEREAAAIPPGDGVIFAPNMPGFYPLLGRRSPVWDIYPIWPAGGQLDRRMRDEIERRHVDWAFLQSARVDQRDELAFRSTHPLTWTDLSENFRPAASLVAADPWRAILLHRAPPPAPAER